MEMKLNSWVTLKTKDLHLRMSSRWPTRLCAFRVSFVRLVQFSLVCVGSISVEKPVLVALAVMYCLVRFHCGPAS